MRVGIVSRIAICLDCGWRCERNDPSTMVKAKRHAEKFRHYVTVELATEYHYNGRKEHVK